MSAKKQSKNTKVITRLAPSPNGFFHIAGIRVLLHNYAYAKKHGGTFILRFEDTDIERSEVEAAFRIIEITKRFGLIPDRYPSEEEIKGIGKFDHWYGADWALHTDEVEKVKDEDFAEVLVQTKRSALYQKYAWELIKKGAAYFCFCTKERLEQVNKEKAKNKQAPGYDGFCRENFTLEQALEKIKAGEEYTVRLDVKNYIKERGKNAMEYEDLILGKMTFDLTTVNDQVLVKSNGIATYHLAVVVDDYLMGITHPVRGWEWIPSTPKQKIIYDVLGWKMPAYGHFNVILDPDRKGKLSKRSGSTNAQEFLDEGYLVDAILNFLMLTGWKSGGDKEFYTLEEFIEAFDLKDVTKSNPTFDREKLLWFNAEYIKRTETQKLKEIFLKWVEESYSADPKLKAAITADERSLADKLELLKGRVRLLSEIPGYLEFFYREMPAADLSEVKGVKDFDTSKIAKAISDYIEIFEEYAEDPTKWDQEKWVSDVRELADKFKWKHGDMFMIIRLAVCGSPFSPPLYESLQILGKEEILKRLDSLAKSLQ